MACYQFEPHELKFDKNMTIFIIKKIDFKMLSA